MIAVDTNVLVSAHRRGTPAHEPALAWIRHLAEGVRPWGIPVFCLGEFLRVTTHPAAFAPPSSLSEAIGALDALLGSPSVRVLSPGQRFSQLLFELAVDGDARGNLAFDAQIAAVCVEQGADRLLTLDRDFRRFDSIRIVDVTGGP